MIEIRRSADHNLECDWGVIEHGEPRPELGQVGALMLATPDYIAELFATGPQPGNKDPEVTHSVTVIGDPAYETLHPYWILTTEALYAHVDYRGHRWSWELHPARFWDDQGPPILLGRWPD